MKAFEYIPPLQSEKRSSTVRRQSKRHLRQRSHLIKGLEVFGKIIVNLLVISISISALTRLLPYYWLQQNKLENIETQVKLMENRVRTLREEFTRNFDPSQAQSIMREHSYRLQPNQRQIILVNPDRKTVEPSDSTQ
ncbi:hypothetical protein [Cylindrospermopsis raciborskii]|uniref:Uncharacterized protein n=1 Tax=Cylindrospermopsis raciborskii CENA302 TaxID=1170768 RepID=A0A9Q5QUW5_9CYAN|nr:hypothetical protein [Cylindrospermopsis raciborskii]NLQ06067.1 hypothetical protein [Cylindrospermopsis raciborskii MVCC19]OHY32379.1 hypothetical protein BCV64_12970 [Cylindrospermopsis raciborskii MVCC14]OPH08704.1 hypothetical protein CENA302_14365 [Cylindrospermopsis raciborskii CENA302]